MHRLIVSTGSNLGPRQKNLESVISKISERIGCVRRASSIYESDAWGYRSKNPFYNQCLEVETELTPEECMDRILKIERTMGRERDGTGYRDRIIDVDILLFDDLVVKTRRMTIPHPGMPDRRFVLLPLAEILPHLRHPVLNLTVSEILEKCPDHSEVRRMVNTEGSNGPYA